MHHFWSKHKLFILLFILSGIGTLASGIALHYTTAPSPDMAIEQRTAETIPSNEKTVSTSPTTENIQQPIVMPTTSPPENLNTELPTTTTVLSQNHDEQTTPSDSASIPVTFTIDNISYESAVPKDLTAYDAMVLLKNRGDITFESKDYGTALGQLITNINGKKNNEERNGKYWIYRVNGTKATAGVSHTIIHDNDTITWTYESQEM